MSAEQDPQGPEPDELPRVDLGELPVFEGPPEEPRLNLDGLPTLEGPPGEPLLKLDGLPVFEGPASEPLPPAPDPYAEGAAPLAEDPYAALGSLPAAREALPRLDAAPVLPRGGGSPPPEPADGREPAQGFDPFGPGPAAAEPAEGFDPFGAPPRALGTEAAEPALEFDPFGAPPGAAGEDPFAPVGPQIPGVDPWDAAVAAAARRRQAYEALAAPPPSPEAAPPSPEAAPPAPEAPARLLGEESFFATLRWLLCLLTVAAALPLWSAWRRGLLEGGSYASDLALHAVAGFRALSVSLGGVFAYSEGTGLLLVLGTLLALGGRVERRWGSGVLAAGFVLGGWVGNLLRLQFEAGSRSLTAISGGWPGAAVVLGLGCALPGAGLGAWLMSFAALVLVAHAGGGAPGVVGVGAWAVGYVLGRGLAPVPSRAPTARGCLALFVTLGAVLAVALGVVGQQVATHTQDLDLFGGLHGWEEPEEAREVGPLSALPAAHLELELELPQGWREWGEPKEDQPYTVFFGHGNERAWLWRFEPHPFNRDPDTFLLRNVIGEIGDPRSRFEAEQVLDEGPFSGALGRGYAVSTACSLRFNDGTSQAGTRLSYCFNLEREVVWLDCFFPADDPAAFAYARKVCDSIARTVRPRTDAPEGGPR